MFEIIIKLYKTQEIQIILESSQKFPYGKKVHIMDELISITLFSLLCLLHMED